MKRTVFAVLLSVLIVTVLSSAGCATPVVKYKSWTEEKTADGSTKVIRTESASQVSHSGKVTLEKIKID